MGALGKKLNNHRGAQRVFLNREVKRKKKAYLKFHKMFIRGFCYPQGSGFQGGEKGEERRTLKARS